VGGLYAVGLCGVSVNGLQTRFAEWGQSLKIYQLTAAAALLTGVVTVTLIPLGVILGFGLWPPVTMNQESYTLFATAFPMMEHGYYFARNAFLFTLAFAYPATIINDLFFKVFPNFSEFERFGAFGLTLHAIYAISIAVVCGRVIFSRFLIFGEKLMILWVAIGYQTLTLLVHNFTEMNYHMLEALLYVACADMTIRWLWTDEAPKRSTAWITGGLAALAIGTKLTFAITMAPFFLIVCLAIPGTWREWFRSLGEFCLSAVLCGSVLLLAYLEFHIEYVPLLLRDLAGLNTNSGWLIQHVDSIASGLRHGFTIGSIMYGFSILCVMLLCTATAALAVRARIPARCRLFAFVSIGVFLFFVPFVYFRLASNTITDVVLWMLFDLAILASMIMRLSAFRWIAIVETACLLWLSATNMYYAGSGLSGATTFWKSQTDAARAIDALIEQRPELPIIYYVPDDPAGIYRLGFPSVDLIPLLSGERRDIENLYLRYARPRVSFAAVGSGLREGEQIAVIPEKVSGVEMPGLSPEFRQSLTSPNCSAVNWGDDGPRGRSRVMVCVVKAVDNRPMSQ
jgi:hypothetical protein